MDSQCKCSSSGRKGTWLSGVRQYLQLWREGIQKTYNYKERWILTVRNSEYTWICVALEESLPTTDGLHNSKRAAQQRCLLQSTRGVSHKRCSRLLCSSMLSEFPHRGINCISVHLHKGVSDPFQWKKVFTQNSVTRFIWEGGIQECGCLCQLWKGQQKPTERALGLYRAS